MLGERRAYGINGSFGSTEKNFSINFSKASATFCLILNCNQNNSYLFVNAEEISSLRPIVEMETFQHSFV